MSSESKEHSTGAALLPSGFVSVATAQLAASSSASSTTSSEWQPNSWRLKPIAQQPEYKDPVQLQECLRRIHALPPLVHFSEILALRTAIAEAGRGKRFILQGGDCAERFQDCSKDPIEAKLRIILQMSLVLVWGARIPTVRIGRVAGQYGKPRSSPYESVNGKQMPAFKGDNVNSFEPTDAAREHDPWRLLQGHFHSACTLNYIRALIKGGYADLHQARAWDFGFVQDNTRRQEYKEISSRILDSLDFMKTCGVMNEESAVAQIDYFTSHEGLLLPYEEAVTRGTLMPANASASLYQADSLPNPAVLAPSTSPRGSPEPGAAEDTVASSRTVYYNGGAHFIWIGDRTRQLDGAHLEYFRGIANPVGVKVGPSMKPDELVALVQLLNPNNEEGRVTLISRFGAKNVRSMLPPLLSAVQAAGLNAVWICDPMHGNTHKTKNDIKTRAFDAILEELTCTFQVHTENGSRLAGVHFELTGENVTECVGGPENLQDEHLGLNYTTYCDPRLNYGQSMEIAFRLAQLLRSSASVAGNYK